MTKPKTNVKPKKKKEYTISNAFEHVFIKGVSSKTRAIEVISKLLAENKVAKTKNGNSITPELITRQVNAMLYDLKQGKGRWAKYKLVESKDCLKIEKK